MSRNSIGNTAKKRGNDAPAVTLSEGTVVMSDGTQWIVRTGQGGGQPTATARRAASCLVEPEAGDRVLVSSGPDDTFILAVLVREGAGPTRLSSEGDVAWTARNGKLQLLGDHGLSLASPEKVSVVAGDLDVHTVHGRLSFDDFGVVGRAFEAHLGIAKTCADAIDRVANRVVDRVKRAYRFVEDVDQLRAGRIDQRAEGLMTLRAEHAVVAAQKLVKMDGGQVHIG